jgi:hypothetical protein
VIAAKYKVKLLPLEGECLTWVFSGMNHNLDVLLLKHDKKEQYILKTYGSCFYY